MRKKLSLLLLCLLLLPVASLANNKQEPQPKPYAFTHVTIIDATGAPTKSDMTLVVVGDRIAALGKFSKTHIPSDARVIDARGKFLIPGLWDMHVHALFAGFSETFFRLFVANGVTGIRDMGTDRSLPDIAKLKEQVESGAMTGPRIFAAGPWVDGKYPVNPGSVAVSNETEGRQAVETLKRQGADFIKVYSLLSRDAYFAIAEEAKAQGISFAGHVPETVTALEASNAGQKSFEHFYGILRGCSPAEKEMLQQMAEAVARSDARVSALPLFLTQAVRGMDTYDEKKAATLFARLAKNQTWQVPTLVWHRMRARLDDEAFMNDARLKYMPGFLRKFWTERNGTRLRNETGQKIADRKRLLQKYLQLVRVMTHAHVEFLAGTDTGEPNCFPGFSLHDELALFVEAGLSPLEALQTATINPARFFGVDRELGTIERGKRADMVLLDANPLADIHNTQRINAVILRGRLFDRTMLNKLLAEVEAIASKR